MSTFDRAFIRAYAKDADLRGTAEPDVYTPDQVDGGDPTTGHAATHSPITYWPADRLYAEGAWYRIEQRQDQAPSPHLPVSWFSSPRTVSAPLPPPSARSDTHAMVASGSHAASEATIETESTQASVESSSERPLADSSELQAGDKLDLSSQYMISATVNYPYTNPDPLPLPHSAHALAPSPGDDKGAIQAETAANDNGSTANATDDARASAVVEEDAVANLSTAAPPHSMEPPHEAANPPSPESDFSRSRADHEVESSASDAATKTAPVGPETPAATAREPSRLDASVHDIPTPHFTVGGAKSAQGPEREIVAPSNDSSTPHAPVTSTSAAAGVAGKATQTSAGRRIPPVTLNPAWEVDAFAWPELTDRLLRREAVRFAQLSKKLTAAAEQGRNVVAVTSPARNQGRSTLSLCLARRLAADGKRVALVDSDFDNPQLAPRLRLNPTCGWQDTIGTDLALDESAVMSLRDGVTLFPLRMAGVPRVDDAIDVSDVAGIIHRLSHSFDLVLLDMEPVEPLDEAPPQTGTLHPAVTGLIVYNATSSHEQLAETVSQLRAVGIETIGAVENQATLDEEH